MHLSNFFLRHKITITAILLACIVSGGLLFYIDTQERIHSAQLHTETEQQRKTLSAQVAQRLKQQVEDARQAEMSAKQPTLADTSSKSSTQSSNKGPSCTAVTNLDDVTVVVNKRRCFSPISWEPNDLELIDGNHLLRAEAASHFKKMKDEANNSNIDFVPSSAYRSYYDQLSVYNYWVVANGSKSVADQVSARPGFSEHQTGLAVDLKVGNCALECFATTNAYTWLTQHAADYGFILRYPTGLTSITGYSAESWHWRYVGIKTAQGMKHSSIKTLEKYLNVTGGDYLYS